MRQILERLIVRDQYCCWRAATISSRLHRVAGQCASAGFLVAIDSTSTRSEGGKALRAARARGILQSFEAVRKIAMTPTANCMAFTVHLDGHLKIRGLIGRGGPQDQPA